MTMLGFWQDSQSRPTAATPVVRFDGIPDISLLRCPLFAAIEQRWTTSKYADVNAVNSEALSLAYNPKHRL